MSDSRTPPVREGAPNVPGKARHFNPWVCAYASLLSFTVFCSLIHLGMWMTEDATYAGGSWAFWLAFSIVLGILLQVVLIKVDPERNASLFFLGGTFVTLLSLLLTAVWLITPGPRYLGELDIIPSLSIVLAVTMTWIRRNGIERFRRFSSPGASIALAALSVLGLLAQYAFILMQSGYNGGEWVRFKILVVLVLLPSYRYVFIEGHRTTRMESRNTG